LERAAELDPRDTETLVNISWIHERFGHDAEAKAWLTRAVTVAEPDDVYMQLGGDWLGCALIERDAADATKALAALGGSEISLGDQVGFNRAFVEGVIARIAKDEHRALLAFAAARAEQEKVIQAQPDFGPAWCVLGMIDAALGRKEEALREGRHALELLPVEKDALVGRYLVRYFAIIAAWVGEKDLACEQLATLVGPPSFLYYGELKLLPLWDPLRGEPCFEKIVSSLAPK
jgi:tetratricopeptide (TPR) repeat protein